MSDTLAAEAPRRIPKLQVRNRIEGLSPPPGLANSSDDITAIRSSPEPQRRIPKLQVRNRIEGLLPPPGFVTSVDDEITRVESPISPTSSLTPSLSRPQFSPTPSSERVPSTRPPLSSQSPRLSFASRMSNSSPEPIAQQPKKSKSVFGFLSLKEPSTLAWQQFVEEQQQQAMLKGSRSVGLTQKKLPNNVPKVNSKWDGMPDHYERSSSSLDIGSFVRNGSSILSRTTSRKSVDTSKPSATSSRPSTARPSTKSSSTSSRQSQKDMHKSSQSSADPSPVASQRPSLSKTSTAGKSNVERPTVTARTTSDRPTTSTRTSSNDTVRLGPTMSIDSRSGEVPELPSPVESMFLQPLESMPELSLFFPPEYIPRDLTRTPPSVLMQEQPRRDETPTPKASTPDDQMSEVPSMEDDSSQDHSVSQSDSASQDSPITPDLSVITIPTEPEPKPRKDSQPRRYPSIEDLPQWPLATKPEDVIPKHFRTVDEIPQWPLPTNPDDVIIENSVLETTPISARVPPTPPNTLNRSSSLERLNFGSNHASSETLPTKTPTYSLTPIGTASSPTSSTSPTRSPTSQAIHQQRSMRSMYNPHSLRGPPAFLPGRVITKDSDLATIPESDTASIRSRNSAYIPGGSTTTLARGEFGDPTSSVVADEMSIAETTDSSQLSEQWRLGLGGEMTSAKRGAPWPLADKGAEEGVEVKSGGVNGEKTLQGQRQQSFSRSDADAVWSKAGGIASSLNSSRRNTLLGVFKR